MADDYAKIGSYDYIPLPSLDNGGIVGFYDELFRVSATDTPAYFWDRKGVGTSSKNTSTSSNKKNGSKNDADDAKAKEFVDIRSAIVAPFSLFNEFKQMSYSGMRSAIGDVDRELYFDNLRARSEDGLWSQVEPTVQNIIKAYEQTENARYKITDFIYNKWYGKIPNNYLITLRKYPLPCQDAMFALTAPYEEFVNEYKLADQLPIVTATTYFGEGPGNNMSDILKFSFGTNWQEQTGAIQTIQSATPGFTGFGGGKFHMDKVGTGTWKYGSIFKSNLTSGANNMFVNGMTGGNVTEFEGITQLKEHYANIDPWAKYEKYTKGPVDVVMKTHNRDQGLNFTNDFTLKFEYSMKSLHYVNPRIAMLDVIGNMVMMGTTTGDWWGGATRYYGNGGGFGKQLGDLDCLRRGDYAGYFKSVANNVQKGFENMAGMKLDGDINVIDLAKNILSGLGKNFLGSLINDKIGKIGATQPANALLTDAPTGYWHIVLGNPLNPILVAGNMICDNVEMTLGSGLGYDDFPMEVSFSVSVKHGKPRDTAAIENMFNAARGRYYVSPYMGDLDEGDEAVKRYRKYESTMKRNDRDPMHINMSKKNPIKGRRGPGKTFLDPVIDTVTRLTR